MNNPKEAFDRLFDRFDESFSAIAEKEGLTFERRSGPSVGRSLILGEVGFRRGVFLELRDHWMKSHPSDPCVTLGWGAWLRPNEVGFPLHLLSRKLYEGNLSGLNRLTELVSGAVAELKALSKEAVMQRGELFTRLPAT